MRTFLLVLLALSFPHLSSAQFSIGQTSGTNISYNDFPDTSVCSHGLERLEIDIDGDQVEDLEFQWGLGTPHQDCWSRGVQLRLVGGGRFGSLPDDLAVGNDLDAQQPFYFNTWADILSYCPDYLDSTFIHWIDWDYFGPGGEGYILLQMDSAGMDFAWVRVSTDTLGGDYCLTLKDAARYRAPVSVEEAVEELHGLEVFPSVVKEDLWLRMAVPRATSLHLRYVSLDGREIGSETLRVLPGNDRFRLSPPATADGLVLLEIQWEGGRKLEKLLFQD